MATNESTMQVPIKMITVANLGGLDKVFGLGHNNKVYYWSAKGWKLLKA